jgi:hypothetical protein
VDPTSNNQRSAEGAALNTTNATSGNEDFSRSHLRRFHLLIDPGIRGLTAVAIKIGPSDLTTNSRAQRTNVVRTNVRQIILTLETDTDTFKRSLDHALDRSPLDATGAEDEINEYVKQFEHATDKLKDRSEDHKYAPNLARQVLIRGRSSTPSCGNISWEVTPATIGRESDKA